MHLLAGSDVSNRVVIHFKMVIALANDLQVREIMLIYAKLY